MVLLMLISSNVTGDTQKYSIILSILCCATVFFAIWSLEYSNFEAAMIKIPIYHYRFQINVVFTSSGEGGVVFTLSGRRGGRWKNSSKCIRVYGRNLVSLESCDCCWFLIYFYKVLRKSGQFTLFDLVSCMCRKLVISTASRIQKIKTTICRSFITQWRLTDKNWYTTKNCYATFSNILDFSLHIYWKRTLS